MFQRSPLRVNPLKQKKGKRVDGGGKGLGESTKPMILVTAHYEWKKRSEFETVHV